jgi:hypothetical protein
MRLRDTSTEKYIDLDEAIISEYTLHSEFVTPLSCICDACCTIRLDRNYDGTYRTITSLEHDKKKELLNKLRKYTKRKCQTYPLSSLGPKHIGQLL